MEYVLMHKDVEVAHVSIDDRSGYALRIISVENSRYMPVGTMVCGHADTDRFRDWWSKRSIPASRSNIRDLLDALEISDTRALLTKSLGLSLSDHYWIHPPDREIAWSSVNYFENPFSDDIGDLLFGKTVERGVIDLSSPDNTSDGNLRKRWKVINGRRRLVKGGTGFANQEPFNEAIASRICEALDIPHVEYSVLWNSDRPYSVCDDFVTTGTELVSAHRAMLTRTRRNDESPYTHYVRSCTELGVDIVPSLDRMLVLDYIIGNVDRHTNNFGLLRDADTLDYIGPAPVFDSGSSLGWNLRTEEITGMAGLDCKPFEKRSSDQIRLVESFDWIDFDALEGFYPDIEAIMDSSKGFIDPARRDAVMGFVRRRVGELRSMANDSRRHR